MNKLKKNNFINLFFISPLLFIVIYFIVNRSPNLPDYSIYEYMYYNDAKIGVEPTFLLFKEIFSNFENGFYFFLFSYAIIGFYLKIIFFYYELNDCYKFFIFTIGYFLSFFIVWDLIQIRYSAGISFFLLGVFGLLRWHKIIYFFLAIMFHYSLVIPIILYIFYNVIKNIYLRIVFIPIMLLIIYIAIEYSKYAEEYDSKNYLEDPIDFLSIRNFLTLSLIVFFTIFYYKNKSYNNFEVSALYYVGIALYVLVFLLNPVIPSAADRIFTLTSFIFFVLQFFIKIKNYNFFLFLIVLLYSVPYFYVQISNYFFY